VGHYEQVQWEPKVIDGVPRAYRQRGLYRAYVPDPLGRTPLALDERVIDLVATATAALSAASRGVGDVDLDSFASLALRSESVAASVIEGVRASAKSVALADFTGHGSLAAQEVARNARIMRLATRGLAQAQHVSLDDVEQLQAQQMTRELVQVQNRYRGALTEERHRAGQRTPRAGSTVLHLLASTQTRST
jgi:4-hydroxy-L-threonine phosphate dehydrogenase PdxA